jgi:hypothetical protein
MFPEDPMSSFSNLAGMLFLLRREDRREGIEAHSVSDLSSVSPKTSTAPDAEGERRYPVGLAQPMGHA